MGGDTNSGKQGSGERKLKRNIKNPRRAHRPSLQCSPVNFKGISTLKRSLAILTRTCSHQERDRASVLTLCRPRENLKTGDTYRYSSVPTPKFIATLEAWILKHARARFDQANTTIHLRDVDGHWQKVQVTNSKICPHSWEQPT